MAYDMNVFAKQLGVGRAADNTHLALRATRDGAPIVLPWHQALVMEGIAYGMHAGSITTPIAGHAAIDADQPEAAVYTSSTGLVIIPLSARISMETGATTLAQGGMLVAVSGIAVGAGTSTSYTPFPLNFLNPNASSASAAHTYTGNGTDPLTAGNHLDLARQSAVIDADAATSGIIPPTLKWTAMEDIVPLIADAGSFLAYGEAAANTVFATLLWAELSRSDIA